MAFFHPVCHGFFSRKINPQRDFVVLVENLDIHFFQKNIHGIQLLNVHQSAGGFHFDIAVGKGVENCSHGFGNHGLYSFRVLKSSFIRLFCYGKISLLH